MLNAVNMVGERNVTVLREGNAANEVDVFIFLFSSFAFLEFLCMFAPPFALVDT